MTFRLLVTPWVRYAIVAIVVSPFLAFGQEYPVKPIRLIIPFAPGGGADLVGRVMTTKISATLGHTMIVENRPGGSGKIRALAIATEQRSAQLPQVPTLGELGYRGLEAYAWFALVAPAKTSPAVIQRLNRAANSVLKQADVRAIFESDGVESAPGTPEELRQFILSETKKWATVIKAAGITPE